jgi:hypothetical protein
MKSENHNVFDVEIMKSADWKIAVIHLKPPGWHHTSHHDAGLTIMFSGRSDDERMAAAPTPIRGVCG